MAEVDDLDPRVVLGRGRQGENEGREEQRTRSSHAQISIRINSIEPAPVVHNKGTVTMWTSSILSVGEM